MEDIDDDTLAQFTSITGAAPDRAAQYLRVSDGQVEQAIQLYFEQDGADMGASLPSSTPVLPQTGGTTNHDPISIDDDEDDDINVNRGQGGGAQAEDDEAMARRLQEEMYGASNPRGGEDLDEEGVRAPQARRAETLLGPGSSDFMDNEDALNDAVASQLNRRQRRAMGVGRPGIFNQAPIPPPATNSIWSADDSESADVRRQRLARATGGASEASSKSSMLAEMFRPPFELISPLRSWEGLRAEGKDQEKWILVNVQDPNVFDCQVLNRDIWKNQQIAETVRENFIFKQYNSSDPQGETYVRLYFPLYQNPDSYPHIAIVDPRTGEQVKVWSGPPAPKPMDFLMQLHEFLDRYSLKAFAKNPVATRKAEKRKELNVDKMTEEEMMEFAMQQSMGAKQDAQDSDPDSLTKGKEKVSDANAIASDGPDAATAETQTNSPFAQISSSRPHIEPDATTPSTTRIQFRYGGGRVIRRFGLAEPVRTLFEWLKATPLEGQDGKEFDLMFLGKNLIEHLDETVETAGLKNGSINVEFIES
ncbi:hypothetical protein FH972_021451 [Carpinus fangiana]|uniref:UAS domain-containing protein n=1 Tax=Carpinus fangiana TaxID=176857 RepID=A0A5N6KRJ7_9ROSI|nr:hypothetical protein FH972_021451 [Carpinus fangiana]